MEQKYMNPGDTVYYVCNFQRIIIPSIVTAVDDIFSGDKYAIWGYRYLDEKENHLSFPVADKMHELGWPVYEQKDYSFAKDLKLVNQFIWIDEPVGHAIQIDDEAFLTLSDAMQVVRPSRKKHLRIRLKHSRKTTQRFIARTWEMNGEEEHPGFSKLPDKKVYVRRW